MMIRRVLPLLTLVSLLPCAPATAGPPARSGKFDINNIDCNNIEALDPRFQRIARRKCQEGQPDFVISNEGAIESEPTPPDVYTGTDKKKLERMILDAWKTRYPEDDVLGVRFHMKNWKTDVNYRANSTEIYETNTSVLAVSVVVKDNSETATIFPAYINRDNHDGSLNAGVDTKKKEYVVKRMLLKNWKP